MLQIRPMATNDIDFALELTSGEGWSDIRSDFISLISYPKTASFVMIDDNERIGMISAVKYNQIGFIGSFIVKREYRKKGYGTKLFDYAIDHLRNGGVELILLDAVVEAKRFYEEKGFKPIFHSHRFRGTIKGEASDYCRSMKEKDLQKILEIDKVCFGDDRSHFLIELFRDHPQLAYVLENSENEIIGFVFASKRREYSRVGPLCIIDQENLARDLLLAVPLHNDVIETRIGVPGYNKHALSLFHELRIPEEEGSIRMGLGNIHSLFRHPGQYAIGSPAKG